MKNSKPNLLIVCSLVVPIIYLFICVYTSLNKIERISKELISVGKAISENKALNDKNIGIINSNFDRIEEMDIIIQNRIVVLENKIGK